MRFPIVARFQEMPGEVAAASVALARRHPLHRPSVHYPDWYLRRWHFLPEGYLSPRSVSWYDQYVRRVYWVFSEGAVLATLTRGLSTDAPATVLEVGCGPGRGLQALVAALPRANVAGIDLSPFMVEAAGRRAFGAEIAQGDATSLPFEDATFDLIVAMHVVGHVPHDVARAMLAEVRRVLRPDGQVILIEHPWHPLPRAGFEHTSSRWRAFGLMRTLTLKQR